jgi:hypothetical protein
MPVVRLVSATVTVTPSGSTELAGGTSVTWSVEARSWVIWATVVWDWTTATGSVAG